MLLVEDLLRKAVEAAIKAGASYADARYQSYTQTGVSVENGTMRSYESEKLVGVGVRVLVKGAWGFASTNELKKPMILEKVRQAVKIAKASGKFVRQRNMTPVKARKDEVVIKPKEDPAQVPAEEKVRICLEANKAAMISSDIKNSGTRLGSTRDQRTFVSSEGTLIKTDIPMVGFSHISVAALNGSMERVPDGRSMCAGFEFIRGLDWNAFTRDVSGLALKAVKSKPPPPGTYTAVADPELIGLFLHEAVGHASEGDLVTSKESVLEGNLGKAIADEVVTVYDDGNVEGGYSLPYDDEGVPKRKTLLVEKGVLRGYLLSRETAAEIGLEPTGNGRAQNFENRPIVRQTNIYMQPGDYNFQELIEDIDFGFYVCGRGALGGQVDVGGGTFTFRAGPCYVIEKGEVKDMVRGVNLAGKVLETLKTIDAVGKDFQIRTSVFGGCGKDGQLARVGDGGPHVRIGKLTIGGQA